MNPLFSLMNDVVWQASYLRDFYREDPSPQERGFLQELATDLFHEITERNVYQNIWPPIQNSVVVLQDPTLPASAVVETASQIIQLITPIIHQGEIELPQDVDIPVTEEELQIAAQEQEALSKEALRKKIYHQFSNHLLYAEKYLEAIYSSTDELVKELFESYDECVFICFPILVEFFHIKNSSLSFEEFRFVHLSKNQLEEIRSIPTGDFMTCIRKRFLKEDPAADSPLFLRCWAALYQEVESRRNVNTEILHLAMQRRDEKLDDRMNECLNKIAEGSLAPQSAINFLMDHEAIKMIPSLPLDNLNQDDTEELLFWFVARGQIDPMIKIFKLQSYEFSQNLLLSLFQEAADWGHFHLFLPLLSVAPINSTTVIRLITNCVENDLTRGLDPVVQSKFRTAIPRYIWNQLFHEALKANHIKTVRWMIETPTIELYPANVRRGFRFLCEKEGNESLVSLLLLHPAAAQITRKEWVQFFQWLRSVPLGRLDQMVASLIASPGFKTIEPPQILSFVEYLMEAKKPGVSAALLRPIVTSLSADGHIQLLLKAIENKEAPLANELINLPMDTPPQIRAAVFLSLVSKMEPSLIEKYLSDPLSISIPSLFLFQGLLESAQRNLPHTFQMIANALLRAGQFPDIPAPLLIPMIISAIENNQFAMIRHLLMLPSARLAPWSSILLLKGLFRAAEAEEIGLVKQFLTFETSIDPLLPPVYIMVLAKMLESGEIETARIMYNDPRAHLLDQPSLFQIARACIRKNGIPAFDFMAAYYPHLINPPFAQQVIVEAQASGKPEIAEKARIWLGAMGR